MTANRILAYTIEQAALVSNFSRSRIYREIKSGDLKSFTIGRRRMISDEALKKRIRELEKQAEAA
jgi:excisionase family DNA binding protein